MNVFMHEQIIEIVDLFSGTSLNQLESQYTNIDIEVERMW